jgi:hypothetical protein
MNIMDETFYIYDLTGWHTPNRMLIVAYLDYSDVAGTAYWRTWNAYRLLVSDSAGLRPLPQEIYQTLSLRQNIVDSSIEWQDVDGHWVPMPICYPMDAPLYSMIYDEETPVYVVRH